MDPKHIYQELKELRETAQQIEIILAKNTQSLSEHMRRTEILEKKMDSVDSDILKLRGFASYGGWLLGICATILTVLSKLGKF